MITAPASSLVEAWTEISVCTFLIARCSHMSLAFCSVPPGVLLENYVCIYTHTHTSAMFQNAFKDSIAVAAAFDCQTNAVT